MKLLLMALAALTMASCASFETKPASVAIQINGKSYAVSEGAKIIYRDPTTGRMVLLRVEYP